MKTEEMKQLIKEFTELVKFHELEAVDSKAVELLWRASGVKGDVIEIDTEFKDHLEIIRQANMHELA